MRQDRIWEIIENAREIQGEIDEACERRDEVLLVLRGTNLTEDQKEAISMNLDGYVAYELSEE
jgi:hypothetical protein